MKKIKFLLAIAKKIKLSIEEKEDILFGKMMVNEETEEYASREELFNTLKKRPHNA